MEVCASGQCRAGINEGSMYRIGGLCRSLCCLLSFSLSEIAHNLLTGRFAVGSWPIKGVDYQTRHIFLSCSKLTWHSFIIHAGLAWPPKVLLGFGVWQWGPFPLYIIWALCLLPFPWMVDVSLYIFGCQYIYIYIMLDMLLCFTYVDHPFNHLLSCSV